MIPEVIAKKLAKEAGKAVVSKVAGDTTGKIEDLLGIAFPFIGLKKAAVDTYIKAIQDSNLSPENKTLAVLNAKQTIKGLNNQTAIVSYAYNAAKPGTDFSESSKVNDDFVSRLLEEGKYVSDEEAQVLWGNVLAGEFEHPGSAPISLIRILSELRKKHAQTFLALCSMRTTFIPTNANGRPLAASTMLFVPSYEYMPTCPEIDLSLQSLTELESLGLIKTSPLFGFTTNLDSNYDVLYLLCGETTLQVSGLTDKGSPPTGIVMLTDAGEYLKQFSSDDPPSGYSDSIMQYLSGLSSLSVSISHTVAFKRIISGDTVKIAPIDYNQGD